MNSLALVHRISRGARAMMNDNEPQQSPSPVRPAQRDRDTVWVTKEDGTTERVLIPRVTTNFLVALLELAKGRRTIATTAHDLGMLTGIPVRTVARSIERLTALGMLTRLETTALRRIRIEHLPDSEIGIRLPPIARQLLEALVEMADGARTLTIRNQELYAKIDRTAPQTARIMRTLVSRGAITEITPATGRSDLFRIDVKRGRGSGLQLTMLQPSSDEDRRHPLLLLAPNKLGIVADRGQVVDL